MTYSYAYMCRDDHVQIGPNDSSSERCPLCRALDAIDAFLGHIENPTNAAEARLALFLYEYRPTSIGKEHCTCDDREGCDECLTTADSLAYLRKLARVHGDTGETK